MSDKHASHSGSLSKNDSLSRPERSRRISGCSVIIPKEQLAEFERWELASFDQHSDCIHQEDTSPPLPTVAELESIRQKAQDEGYAQGRDAGYADGIRQAHIDAAQIHMLMQNLQVALNRVDEQVAQSLLDLSLEIACKMAGETLRTKPEVILNIVSDAINSLPHFNQNAHLIMHPEDAELVRSQMGEQLAHAGWKIFTDAQIERGGCRVETLHSQVDATTASRWKRIVKSIGQDTSWMA